MVAPVIVTLMRSVSEIIGIRIRNILLTSAVEWYGMLFIHEIFSGPHGTDYRRHIMIYDGQLHKYRYVMIDLLVKYMLFTYFARRLVILLNSFDNLTVSGRYLMTSQFLSSKGKWDPTVIRTTSALKVLWPKAKDLFPTFKRPP